MTESIYNFWEICAEFSKKKKKHSEESTEKTCEKVAEMSQGNINGWILSERKIREIWKVTLENFSLHSRLLFAVIYGI